LPVRKKKVIIVYIPRRRTTYHHGDLRNALVTAALQAIAEEGAEGFTLRDAARRAGVSPAAPYRHFADRDALLGAVAAEVMERLGAAMDAAVAQAGTTDPLEIFRATGVAYVRFAVEHPAHFRIMNMPTVLARTPPETHAAVEDWGRQMIDQLAAAQRAAMITDAPLADVLLAANCMVHGLAHRIVSGLDPELAALDADGAAALATRITYVLGVGLLPRVTAAKAKRSRRAG
jgi:AcrR family transcriptional regulator